MSRVVAKMNGRHLERETKPGTEPGLPAYSGVVTYAEVGQS